MPVAVSLRPRLRRWIRVGDELKAGSIVFHLNVAEEPTRPDALPLRLVRPGPAVLRASPLYQKKIDKVGPGVIC